MKISSIIFLVIFCLFGNLFAGGVITIEESRRGKTIINKTYIENNMMRIESNYDGELFVSIFNADKEVLYSVDYKKQSYIMITKKDLEKVGAKLSEVNDLLMEKLKDLPKEQQEMMKKMMGKSMDNIVKEKPDKKYTRTGKSEKINNWDCDKYEVKEADVLTKEVWVTDWKNSGLQAEYKNVMKGVETFFKFFTDQLGDKVNSKSLTFDFSLADKGVPIKTINYNPQGEQNGSSLVKEIKEEDIPLSTFMVPSDFKKENPFAQIGNIR